MTRTRYIILSAIDMRFNIILHSVLIFCPLFNDVQICKLYFLVLDFLQDLVIPVMMTMDLQFWLVIFLTCPLRCILFTVLQ